MAALVPPACLHGRILFAAITLLVPTVPTEAASSLPRTMGERIRDTPAILTGTVLGTRTATGVDGVWTVASVAVEETLKGFLPERLDVRVPGGVLGDAIVEAGGFPLPRVGDRMLLWLEADAQGRPTVAGPAAIQAFPAEAVKSHVRSRSLAGPPGWGDIPVLRAELDRAAVLAWLTEFPDAAHGAADWSTRETVAADAVAEAPGFVLSSGRGARFAQADRGPIPYEIDWRELPPGITQERAREAVETALAAWAAVAGLEFVFQGVRDFGTAASNTSAPTPTLHLQLHNLYGGIPGSTTLGVGGRTFQPLASNDEGALEFGGRGGRVSGYNFNLTINGYVIMAHQQGFFANNAVNFEEVLVHEIGHALGLGHSSESAGESNNYLRQAIMYYTAHGGGRGATLAQYDADVIGTGYPAGVRVPALWSRNLRVVTRHAGATQPDGTNRWFLPVLEHHGLPISWIPFGTTSNVVGTFLLVGDSVAVDPGGPFSPDPAQLSPTGNSSYARILLFADNGTHRSAPVELRIIAANTDSNNDGLPDRWMTDNFGSATPVAGLSRPQDDPDGDGLSNLREYRAGTDPRRAASPRAEVGMSGDRLTFAAVPMEVYAIDSAPRPDGPWTLVTYVQPGSESGSWQAPAGGPDRLFYRVRHVD